MLYSNDYLTSLIKDVSLIDKSISELGLRVLSYECCSICAKVFGTLPIIHTRQEFPRNQFVSKHILNLKNFKCGDINH